jgi:hypothetical protein
MTGSGQTGARDSRLVPSGHLILGYGGARNLGSIVFQPGEGGRLWFPRGAPRIGSQAAQPARHLRQWTSSTGLPLISRLTQCANLLPLTFTL